MILRWLPPPVGATHPSHAPEDPAEPSEATPALTQLSPLQDSPPSLVWSPSQALRRMQ